MKNKIPILLLLLFLSIKGYSQTRTITGLVSDANGEPLPGVNIFVEGTSKGVQTDFDGKYSISADLGDTLNFSYIGMATKKIKVTSEKMDVQMEEDAQTLSEVVVTALGIEREKKAVGYAVQKVEAAELTGVKSGNFANALSGKVAGLNIKRNSNLGGSTNIVIRGSNSLSGDSQALFVVDGIPISNRNSNTTYQLRGFGGYDYGNSGMDINPEDIASIEVLKGGAASALYGSLAANGVIMITTKKGKEGKTSVTLSSTTTVGLLNKSTFPTYQNLYGAGYSRSYGNNEDAYFNDGEDVNGDGVTGELIVPTSEDASFGAAFDGQPVYQWDSFYRELPTFRQATPWLPAKNGPLSYFRTPVTLSNTVALSGGNDKLVYRLAYTRFDQSGAEPNSQFNKDNISFSSDYDFTDKFSVSTSVNYTYQNVIGRNTTGYNTNTMVLFRQWWQTNVDIKEQEAAYRATGKNISWNPVNYERVQNGGLPIYHDNPFFRRYRNYESDNRGRWIANTTLKYKFIDTEKTKISAMAQFAIDTYQELQEERLERGSVPAAFRLNTVPSGYLRRDLSSRILHYNLIVNFKQTLSKDIGLSGLVGATIRRDVFGDVTSETNGGLKFDGVYALSNSLNPIAPPEETVSRQTLNGIYANTIFDYKNIVFLDLAFRADQSSTLPRNKNVYVYPSVSGSFIFTELMNVGKSWLSFGKLRANWAQVGNATGFNLLRDVYVSALGINGAGAELSANKRNPDLRSERQTSAEIGLEAKFFSNKLGLDVAVYQNNTRDQITPVTVSLSTGYVRKYVNAGEIQNRGLEITLSGNQIPLGPVKWSPSLNWSKNVSEVLSLADGTESLTLASLPGGVTINAVKGQPFGVIYGTDYVYNDKGQRIVNQTSGAYRRTSNSNNILGSQVPDFIAGFRNTFTYKNFDLSFLIDTSWGGKIFSLDMAYGLSSGLYPETAYINDLGNPVRNTLQNGGGFINAGVAPDGSENTVRARGDNSNHFGYNANPNAAFVYDASYIKLRELSIGWSIPIKNKNIFKAARVSAIGSNLFIFYKNLPYADPENGLASGNIQGYSVGSLPSFREVSLNLSFTF